MPRETNPAPGDLALRCLRSLERFLRTLTGNNAGRRPSPRGSGATRAEMHSAGYSLRFRCLGGPKGRIMADMDSPYPKRFQVGRQRTDGSSPLCLAGALLFIDYLRHEGLLQDFQDDLDASLAPAVPPGEPEPGVQ